MAKLLVPMTIDDAALTASNLSEDATYSAWSSGTTYGLGDYAYVASTHKVYQSTQASNTNHDPTTDDGTWWVEGEWTNKWKALSQDSANPTVAESTSGITYTITANAICTEVAFKGVKASSVSVSINGGTAVVKTATETINSLSWYKSDFVFTGLSIANGDTVAITIADPANSDMAEVGLILVGYSHDLGPFADDIEIGFEDLSEKEQDADGEFTITERGVSGSLIGDFKHETALGRWVKGMLTQFKDTPCLIWQSEAMIDAGIMIFGYVIEPQTTVEVGYSLTAIEVTGLAFTPTGMLAA